MDKYTIILTNEKAATYKVVTFIIAGINLLVFLYFLLTASSPFNLWVSGIGLCMLAAAFIYYFRVSLKTSILHFNMAFVGCGITWILLGMYLGGCLMCVFAFFGWFVSKELKIVFSSTGCLYPSFPNRLIPWSDIDQVRLKDNVLTIDLKSNQLLQFVISNLENIPDESVFNLFCNQMLQTSIAA
jgi:Leucine-rich repeat (LRR) protein